MVMCPHRKLHWCKEHHRAQNEIDEIRERVVTRWMESYKPHQATASQNQLLPSATAGDHASGSQRRVPSKWADLDSIPIPSLSRSTSSSSSVPPTLDELEVYLNEPVMDPKALKTFGGVLKYWESEMKSSPNLAKMGLDFCSAPASSVDAERAFSRGRLTINHLQHNMTSQTFKARMALGSWSKTPLFDGLTDATRIIERRISHRARNLAEESSSGSEDKDESDF